MRTTLTQRIAAAEALIAEQREMLSAVRKDNSRLAKIKSKLVAEHDDDLKACEHESLERISKLTDDLQDAQVDNDRLQSRLSTSEAHLEAIRSLKHPWYMHLIHPKDCPICIALHYLRTESTSSKGIPYPV